MKKAVNRRTRMESRSIQPVTIVEPEPRKMVEVTRSFSFKLHLGNYESADFFCSQKAQCSPEQVDEVSRDLYEFCIDQVQQAIKDFKARRAKARQGRDKKVKVWQS